MAPAGRVGRIPGVRTLALCYHALSERWPADLAIAPDRFEQHIALLQARGYRGVTFHEAVNGSARDKTVAITFDDAYRSVIELALPILAGAGFPATVFAPTSFIGTEAPMKWPGVEQWLATEHAAELVPMSWDELGGLAGAGWEVGSHTRSHPRLPDLDPPALDRELAESRRDVERHLDLPCRSLGYPYGAYDQTVVAAAGRAGYTAAAGTLPGRLHRPTGQLDWSRIVVNRGDHGRRFRAKISPVTLRAKSSPAWSLIARARRATRSVTPRRG